MERFKKAFKITKNQIVSTVIISLVMAVLYFVCIHFRDFNTITGMYDSTVTAIKYLLKITVLAALLFLCINAVRVFFAFRAESISKRSGERHRVFFFAAWAFIVGAYMVWLIGTYPGSANLDTELQFKYFLGIEPWSMWHPPLSTFLMGSFYSFGMAFSNPNLGFFLYQFFQTLVAGAVFSYAMTKLLMLGISRVYAIAGVLFYSLIPMFGAYAAWVEKDFLFATVFVLFITMLTDVVIKKDISFWEMILLSIVSTVCSFLRNNGIYALFPALFILIFVLKGKNRWRIFICAAALICVYGCFTRIVFPKAGISGTSISEVIGVTFQQTARYVNTYPDEVTEKQKEIIEKNFQSYDVMKNYDPVINDPVKIYYNNSDPKGYFKVWRQMLFKHPLTFLASYINGSYGYLAPVKADTGAYINSSYTGFLSEQLGLSMGEKPETRQIFIDLLNGSSYRFPTKYLNMPGLYTWFLLSMMLLVASGRKKRLIVLFIPSFVTLLVCTVSPLACAMRYALPIVLATPLLIGLTMYSYRND
ncbi:MAG: hypothetical protein IJ796_08945 [Lachnospiraceae bacterium]|nr:hypothetical protein [Lachnospiraceae bacterium]